MKNILIVHENLIINALTSSTIIDFSNDEEVIHKNINDENIDENESIVDDDSWWKL